MIKAVRGTRDLLPPDTALWNFVEAVARDVFRAYNFQEIRTPIFEETALFARGVGEETDIVAKEMYTWEDRSRAASEKGQSLTLRPEATAGIVRAYIEHKLGDRGLNKLYCIGPMFRRERPQKGRYRQFYQIDAEVIGPSASGSESPARDAEVLEMLATLLDRLGITDWNLELNSVGTPADRVQFNEALRKALGPVVGQMCNDCQRRAVTNPLRVFDCKVPEDQPIIETLPRITQFLSEDSRAHFEAVQAILTKVGVPFSLNDRLVRGLDYYTRTAFEFTHGALGAQNAILGGGRYDGLSEALGGPPAPGIGFAIGEDRLVMSLQERTPAESVLRKPDVYVAPMAGMNGDAARLARELRRNDLVVELGDDSFRLKKSFEVATKAGAKYILIIGENEVQSDSFALKNLATGEQVSVPRANCWLKRFGRIEHASDGNPGLPRARPVWLDRFTGLGARMKRGFAVFVLALCGSIAFARVGHATEDKPATPFEQMLMNDEKGFIAAAKKGDVTFFKNTLTTDFSFVAFDGELYGRQDMHRPICAWRSGLVAVRDEGRPRRR